MSRPRTYGGVLLVAASLCGCSPQTGKATAAQGKPPTTTTAAPVPSDPALARVDARISKDGPAAYLKQVGEGDADWRALLARMSQGEGEALVIAGRLRPASDAGTSEALDTAAARGLPHAPVAVLGLTRAGATIGTLCTSPFIEPEPGVEKRYNAAAMQALDRVPTARRPPGFDACYAALKAIRAQL